MLQATSREAPGDQKAKQRPTGSQAGFTCLRMNQPRTTIFGQAHTIKDVLHILEPAFGAGLPRPTDEQLARKCLGYYIAACVSQGDVALLSAMTGNMYSYLRSFTISAKSCAASSVNVIAGAQKQFYVTKTISGELGDWVRKIFDLKALVET